MWQARTTIHPTHTSSGINDHEGPVLIEKPIAAQLTAIYGTRKFTTAFNAARQWFLS